MSKPITLSNELRKLIETRLEQTLKGIEDTLTKVLEKIELNPYKLKEEMKTLKTSFNLLFQKWNLEILYLLFLKESIGFGELKKVLSVNSRTLSDKLKILKNHKYIQRKVSTDPPLRVNYHLTQKGRNTVLLALPLLYYSTSAENQTKS